ncbi:DUF6879 family protein [Actinomadura sp. 3N508]|uniref:DUF6879 family protein n=1 Tax=Actinomadura sp. 3N508 TaxID=3375153 RepID=UPI0037B98FD3
MTMELPPLGELLARCERSVVHLELRDVYYDPAEAKRVAAWRAGHRDDPADQASWWRPFHQDIADTVARGVSVRRARIVSEPITEYVSFEYDITFQNLAAGEQVRWLPRRRASHLALPGNDFWLFDDHAIRWHHFAGDGTWMEDELDDDPDAIALCRRSFESVWDLAVPHRDYSPR